MKIFKEFKRKKMRQYIVVISFIYINLERNCNVILSYMYIYYKIIKSLKYLLKSAYGQSIF